MRTPRSPRAVTLIAAALAATVLASCGTRGGAPTETAVTRPNRALDVGLVALTVPTSWTVRSSLGRAPCTGAPASCGCAPGPSDTIVLAVAPPQAACGAAASSGSDEPAPPDAVWVVASPGHAGPVDVGADVARRSIAVVRRALSVTLIGYGAEGAAIVRTARPDPLDELLSGWAGARTPRSWRSIGLGGIELSVPPSWPVHDLASGRLANPGLCGGPTFEAPVADLGVSPVTLPCPTRPGHAASPPPSDGVWLSAPDADSLSVRALSADIDVRDVHGVLLAVSYLEGVQDPGTIVVAIRGFGLPPVSARLVLGVGASPRVADEILSSVADVAK